MPVEFTTGIPLTPTLSGVVGVSNSRFYHHALPIFGLIGNLSPTWRLEALYPKPALIYALNQKISFRLGGQLVGAGFAASALGRNPTVEYISDRIGVEASYLWKTDYKLTVVAGSELERSFDFFPQNQHLHGDGSFYGQGRLTL